MRRWGFLVGSRIPGRLHDVKYVRTYKCFEFDGNVPHMTMPFYGSRYSLVFFERRSSAEASQRQKDELLRLGFPLADWPMWNQIRWHSLAWGSYGARMGPYN